MERRTLRRLAPASALLFLALPPPARGAAGPRPADRSASLRAVCGRLGIGEGAAVADVGCGSGGDSVILARIVGSGGRVYAEEIDEKKIEKVRERAGKDGLAQIAAVLGRRDDPRLPDGGVDLIYLRHVYHHFARPRVILTAMWHDLRPGGHLVVVDRRRGPLRDRVPLEEREKKHHWTGETAVVRQAREAGFAFVDALEELWHEKDPFVLLFQRPREGKEPDGDPDLPLPFEGRRLIEALRIDPAASRTVAVVALDRGRAVLPALREVLGPGARLIDIVPEEWAVTRDEVPPNPSDVRAEILRTDEGDLRIPEDVVLDAVLFADAYHRIWDPARILARLKAHLAAGGFLAIADRKGPAGETRRLAGHRRRIDPGLVRADLEAAGFAIDGEVTPPAPDRFAIIARPKARIEAPEIAVRETDEAVEIDNGAIVARIRKKGYVSGVEAGMRDKRTGARSLGFGLHVMDFLLGPGWRDDGYLRDPAIHGRLPKHYEEGPQICTQARALPAAVVRGPDFVAVKLAFTFTEGHEGHGAGSRWEQTIVFPAGARYFLSAETITCAHPVKGLFYRIDMPGHVRRGEGEGFSEIYLSYHGRIPAKAFARDFGPDERFLYHRGASPVPPHFIRAYRTVVGGRPGPWLAGMTLRPDRVYEAWCHARGYVCFIEEIGGRDVRPGDRIGAAYAVGFFDTIEEMERVYDRYRGATRIAVDETGFEPESSLDPRHPAP